jgi:hypothetical protein
LISRFSVIRGVTPHELAFGGKLCRFGEPVFACFCVCGAGYEGFSKVETIFFLGKPATQSSYVLFDGQAIIPSRNVRKINTTWRSHMACYLHCKCFSWQYKAGFGARIHPTMKKPIPKAVGFDVPLGWPHRGHQVA